MIVRVFRATIPRSLHGEFEKKFREVSAPLVQSRSGLVSVEIARPTRWNPDEFVMVSRWNDEESLIAFAGESWHKPHIPAGMEQYISEFSVDHYTVIPLKGRGL